MKINYFFTSLFCFFFVLTSLGANCPHPDYAALAALYNATNGASWTNTTNNDRPWDVTNQANCDPCSWYGVTCENGRVSRLDLRENNLVGTLPSEIGNLVNLTFLPLGKNTLSGPIPAAIGNLTKLTDLRLNDNQFTSLPPEIGNLVLLELLLAGQNKIANAIPITINNLSKLKVLRLQNNMMTGSIPELGNLLLLEELSLHDNQLTGSIPSSMVNLTNLQRIFLNKNQLSGNIPTGINQLNQLKELWLSDNQLTGGVNATLGGLPNLQILRLSRNQLGGTIPVELGNLAQLQQLYISDNQLLRNIPAEIGNLANLEFMCLFNNQIDGTIPSTFKNLSKLKFLGLYNNQLSGKIPSEFVQLTNLTSLRLYDNNFDNCIPPTFKAFCTNNVEVQLNNVTNTTDHAVDFTNFCTNDTGACSLDNDNCDSPTLVTVYPDKANCTSLLGTTVQARIATSGTLNDCLPSNNQFSSVWYRLPNATYSEGVTISIANFNGNNGIGVALYRLVGSACAEAATEGAFSQINCTYQNNSDLELVINSRLNAPSSPLERFLIEVWTRGGASAQGNFEICVYNTLACPSTLNLSDSPTQSKVYQASTSINATATINSPLNITYKAGQNITLSTNFEAKTGATFLATIENCNNTLQSSEERNLDYLSIEKEHPSIKLLDKTNFKIYPNPFYHQTTIDVQLPAPSPISIQLFDFNGRQIKTIVTNASFGAGSHQLTLESGDLQAGIYYLNMRSEQEQIVRKVLIGK